MIALETNYNATRIVGCEDQEILIPQGCVLIWSGGFDHTGAGYSKVNGRLLFYIIGPDYVSKLYSIVKCLVYKCGIKSQV